MNSVGLYIHIPFCLSKCPYCDFYSVKLDKGAAQLYKKSVIRNLARYDNLSFDTVYFGGGTPVLLHEEICDILSALGGRITSDAEVTVEANPCCADEALLRSLKASGVNRISFGLQSGCDNELKALGRRHNAEQGKTAVIMAHDCGFDNISADLMLGIPRQTETSVETTLEYALSLPLSHISAYMLKIEEGTPFAKADLSLPSDDGYADIYLKTVQTLEENGFNQYEISNFSLTGKESRHNLKYWRCEEYIGIGPGAHSYFNEKRYAVPKNLDDFIASEVQAEEITDIAPADFSEWAMLRLRLKEGIDFKTARERFSIPKEQLLDRCRRIPQELLSVGCGGISLTAKGFLVSNAIIGILADI